LKIGLFLFVALYHSPKTVFTFAVKPMDLRYAGCLSQGKNLRFEQKRESASCPSPGYFFLFDPIRRIDSRDKRVQVGLMLEQIRLPPLSDKCFVITSQLAFVWKYRPSFEMDMTVPLTQAAVRKNLKSLCLSYILLMRIIHRVFNQNLSVSEIY